MSVNFDNVSNPFNLENFGKILNIFLKSGDKYTFYSNLAVYHSDSDFDPNLPYEPMEIPPFCYLEQSNSWNILHGLGHLFQIKHKIYINSPNKNLHKIAKLFAERCLKEDVPFELKIPDSDIKRDDSIVIYSCDENFKKHINILRDIAYDYPDLKNECGTPHILTAILDGWLGLADEYKLTRSYNEMIQSLLIKTLNQYIYEHEELRNKVPSFDVADYEIFLKQNPDNIFWKFKILSEEDRKMLQDYFSNNKEDLLDLYNMFLQNCKKMGRDTNNPCFTESFKKDIEATNQSSTKDDSELIEAISKPEVSTSDILIVLNKYKDKLDKLTIQTKTKIIKVIIGKNSDRNSFLSSINNDIYVLMEAGAIDSFFTPSFFVEKWNGMYESILDVYKKNELFNYEKSGKKEIEEHFNEIIRFYENFIRNVQIESEILRAIKPDDDSILDRFISKYLSWIRSFEIENSQEVIDQYWEVLRDKNTVKKVMDYIEKRGKGKSDF